MNTVVAVRDSTADANVGDAASMQSVLIGSLTTLSDVFTKASVTLGALRPPPVAGAADLSSTTEAFRHYGEQFSQSAATLAAADPENTVAQLNATTSLQSGAQQALATAKAVRDIPMNSQTKAAIREIKSCGQLAF